NHDHRPPQSPHGVRGPANVGPLLRKGQDRQMAVHGGSVLSKASIFSASVPDGVRGLHRPLLRKDPAARAWPKSPTQPSQLFSKFGAKRPELSPAFRSDFQWRYGRTAKCAAQTKIHISFRRGARN